MNAIKSSRCLLFNFKRCNPIVEKNTRFLCSANKYLDVDVNTKTGISTVSFKRAPVNSLGLELVNEFISTMMLLEKDKAKGMVLTSAVPGIFSAGLDLMELCKPNQDRLKAYWTAIQDVWLNLYSANYSTAVALTGHSPGAGCLIAVSCDYRVMVKGKFGIGLNEVQLGLAAPSWFVDTFRNVIPKRVSELALISGKMFSADEALSVGLVDEVADDNKEAIAKAEGYVSKLSKFSQVAMAQTKLTIRYEAIKRLQENREDDLRVFLKFVNSPEIQKGLEMYMESIKKK